MKILSERQLDMPTFLYPNFLTDPAEYRASIAFWENLFAESLPDDQKESWVSWLAVAPDGNSIFSRRHKTLPYGVSIHQEKPSSDSPFLQNVRRIFDERGTIGAPITHMVLICELSSEVVPLVKLAIEDFLKEMPA